MNSPISPTPLEPGQHLSHEFHGRGQPFLRDMMSPPPADPLVRSGPMQIMQPRPAPPPTELPSVFQHQGQPDLNHSGQPPLNATARSVPSFMNDAPPRMYSAPMMGVNNYRPPPRNASILHPDNSQRPPQGDKSNSSPVFDGKPGSSYTPYTPPNGHQQLPGTVNGVVSRPSSRASTDPHPHPVLRKASSSRSLLSQFPPRPQFAPPTDAFKRAFDG